MIICTAKKIIKVLSENKINPGDLVKIEPNNITGEIMPKPDSSDSDIIIIKFYFWIRIC